MNTADDQDLMKRFWSELGELRTGMLGLTGGSEAHAQPMTAHFDGPGDDLYFYARKSSGLAQGAESPHEASFHYAGKGHDLFACVHGELSADDSSEAKRRFWSREVERWFPDGPDDSNLTLLRFTPSKAEIWLPNQHADSRLFGLSRRPPADVRDEVRL